MDNNAPTQPHERPLDKRRRETRPERIVVGDEVFARNDVLAAKYGLCERTLNRGDAEGAPFLFFGGVKYRPEKRYDAFVLSRIQQAEPPERRRGR